MAYVVYPENDLQEHDLEGTQCACLPKIIWDYAEPVIIHNSFDGRELMEPICPKSKK